MDKKEKNTRFSIQNPEDAQKMGVKSYVVDASDKSLGRLAGQIAVLLRGKASSDFQRNKDPEVFVFVKNVDKLVLTGKKMEQKNYYKHSGYMGGLKETPVKKVFENNPKEVLKRAVFGMLPKNKLRDSQIKRLKVVKG